MEVVKNFITMKRMKTLPFALAVAVVLCITLSAYLSTAETIGGQSLHLVGIPNTIEVYEGESEAINLKMSIPPAFLATFDECHVTMNNVEFTSCERDQT